MPCYICGKALDKITLDGRDMKPAPCSECQEVISETVAAFNDDGHNYTEEEFDEHYEIDHGYRPSEFDLGDPEWG